MPHATIPAARPFSARIALTDGPAHRALTRRRHAERNFHAWRRERKDALEGPTLATLVEGGRLRPFEDAQLDAAVRADVHRLVPKLVGYIRAAERAIGRHLGVIAAHRDVARWLDCSERTAGTVVRAAVACGLVEQRPWFWARRIGEDGRIEPAVGTDAEPKTAACEAPAHLLPGPIVRAFERKREIEKFRRAVQVGKSCQLSDQQRASHTIECVSLRETVDCLEPAQARSRQGETADDVTWPELRAVAQRLARSAGERCSRGARLVGRSWKAWRAARDDRKAFLSEKEAVHAAAVRAEHDRVERELARRAAIERVEQYGVDDPELAALCGRALAHVAMREDQNA